MSKTLELTQQMAAAEQAARPVPPPPLTMEDLMARKGYEVDGVTPLPKGKGLVLPREVFGEEISVPKKAEPRESKSRSRRERIQRLPTEIVTMADIGIAPGRPRQPIVDDGDAMKTPGPEHSDDHDEEGPPAE